MTPDRAIELGLGEMALIDLPAEKPEVWTPEGWHRSGVPASGRLRVMVHLEDYDTVREAREAFDAVKALRPKGSYLIVYRRQEGYSYIHMGFVWAHEQDAFEETSLCPAWFEKDNAAPYLPSAWQHLMNGI